VLAVAAVLAIGLVALLLLHTLAAQDAFTVHKLQHRTAALADQVQALTIENEQAQAPSSLAARAAGLGMVPATSLTITQLHGRPAAMLSAPPLPPPAPVATSTPTAKPTPATSATKPTAKSKPTPRPTPTHH
jgi:outer membrane biosynthesis protein TonB